MTTGFATGVLAVLSAGSLATLGLLGASELAGQGPLGGPLARPGSVQPPRPVVVTPSTGTPGQPTAPGDGSAAEGGGAGQTPGGGLFTPVPLGPSLAGGDGTPAGPQPQQPDGSGGPAPTAPPLPAPTAPAPPVIAPTPPTFLPELDRHDAKRAAKQRERAARKDDKAQMAAVDRGVRGSATVRTFSAVAKDSQHTQHNPPATTRPSARVTTTRTEPTHGQARGWESRGSHVRQLPGDVPVPPVLPTAPTAPTLPLAPMPVAPGPGATPPGHGGIPPGLAER